METTNEADERERERDQGQKSAYRHAGHSNYSQRKTFAESAVQTRHTTASAAMSLMCADHASPIQIPCSSDTA